MQLGNSEFIHLTIIHASNSRQPILENGESYHLTIILTTFTNTQINHSGFNFKLP